MHSTSVLQLPVKQILMGHPIIAHAANFTLEVLDVPNSNKKKQNITILFKKKFNGMVKYGRSIVFFANITAPLVANFQRIIRLTPHTPMKICERSYLQRFRS